MRFFTAALFCVSLIMATLPVQAQSTPVNRDQANEYFALCIKGSQSTLGESMRDLCACTSAKLMTQMTAEELAALADTKTPAGQAARKKELVEVYAPCTELIAAEMFDFECVNNKQLREMNKDFDMPAVCSCASKMTANWYKGKGQQFMDEAMKKDPGMTLANPVGALLTHPLVKSQNLNNLVTCSSKPAAPAVTEDAAPAATPATGVTP